MTRFDVFLDFHPEYVRVYRKGNLVLHRLYFSLFLFNRATHIVHPLFEGLFYVTSGLNFLSQSLLVQIGLLPHLFVMQFEILV